MKGSTLLGVHVVYVYVRRDKLDLLAFGQIGRLVQNEATVLHAGSERLLHRFQVYSVAGPSSKDRNGHRCVPHPQAVLDLGASVASTSSATNDGSAMGEAVVGPNGETLEEIALPAYPQAKQIRHVHTAGNSSGIVDGEAALAIASKRFISERGIKPRARIRSVATIGHRAAAHADGTAPASRKTLKLAGMEPKEVDLWESTRRSRRSYCKQFAPSRSTPLGRSEMPPEGAILAR